MRLALAQIAIEGGDVESNRGRAASAIESAAEHDADLVALPEIFNVGYFAFDTYQRNAEALDGPTLTQISDLADEHDIAVLAGSIVEDLSLTDGERPAEEGLANTSVFFDRDGRRQAVYRKHHLFGYESAEAEMLVPGESLGIVELEGVTVGMATCYDLRFPELYRDIAEAGATLVLVPSAWPYPRVEHWQILSRARAIENQCFLATINGSGSYDDATLIGRSTVYDPWGTLLASTGDEPDMVVRDIDPKRVEQVRKSFPAWHDKRR
ncbi:carbon-nitrogen family hydrolase [Haladaptatus caseinilyticus]|uniref:carbon-nitrogen family hydrolase n=1 Tax=Haladaptatus caseinilyticus TaxID=2993314 RepID=UPI00224A7844|nr:carbon-nitrogen family hydrolase [Haladaptatus caseinilyticus]